MSDNINLTINEKAERDKAANALAMMEARDTESGTETPTKKSTGEYFLYEKLTKYTSLFLMLFPFVAASRMVDHWINNQRMSSGTRSPVSGTESPIRTPGKKRLTIKANMSEHEPKAKVASLSDRFTVKTIQQAATISTAASKKKTSPKVQNQKISVLLPNTNKKSTTKAKQTVTVVQQKKAAATASKTT